EHTMQGFRFIRVTDQLDIGSAQLQCAGDKRELRHRLSFSISKRLVYHKFRIRTAAHRGAHEGNGPGKPTFAANAFQRTPDKSISAPGRSNSEFDGKPAVSFSANSKFRQYSNATPYKRWRTAGTNAWNAGTAAPGKRQSFRNTDVASHANQERNISQRGPHDERCRRGAGRARADHNSQWWIPNGPCANPVERPGTQRLRGGDGTTRRNKRSELHQVDKLQPGTPKP